MAVENVDAKGKEAMEKHTKCVEVNSYVLKTSGVLMFFVFVLAKPYELRVVISSWGR